MATNSKIEWTKRTWNPILGCSIISPGCHNCYAMTMARRLKAMALADLAAGKEPGRKRHYIDVIGPDGRWNGKLVLGKRPVRGRIGKLGGLCPRIERGNGALGPCSP